MKAVFFFFSMLLWIPAGLAQQGLPEFGKISQPDLLLPDCSFDKGAGALKLIDWCRLHFDGSSGDIGSLKTIYERRIRIKIFKESSIGLADVRIPFIADNDFERITAVEGFSFNLDEKKRVITTALTPEAIFQRKINNRISELVIPFPQVKPGTVIEYRYKLTRADFAGINNWFFQGTLPVAFSRYEINIPSFLHFKEIISVADSLSTTESVTNDGFPVNRSLGNIRILRKTYSMRNLPAVHAEPFMGALKDYLQKIEFQLSDLDYGNGIRRSLQASWKDISRQLDGDEAFGAQLRKTIPVNHDLLEQVRSIPDSLERMKWVFRFLKQKIGWNGEYDIYSHQGVSDCWQKGTGNSADINLLLINLLTSVGLPALPVLFSTREHGVVREFYPDIGQFNTVLACLELNKRQYLLDASAGYTLPGQVPAEILNTKGLLFTEEGEQWVEASAHGAMYKLITAIHGELDEDGRMTGFADISAEDYARRELCEKWVRDKTEFTESFLSEPDMNLTLLDVTVNNVRNDSLPLEIKTKFQLSLPHTGEYRSFRINLFNGLRQNPFLAEDRLSDVDFGYGQEYILFGSYTIPPGYVFDEWPPALSLEMPDKSITFTRFIDADNNLLSVKIAVEFSKPVYSSTQYSELREFYKQLLEELNKVVVIRRKALP